MSSWCPVIKWLHIVSSTVLFGTGAGIAFYFLRAQRTGDTKIIAAVSGDVVLADMVIHGNGKRLTTAGGISAVLPLLVCAAARAKIARADIELTAIAFAQADAALSET
jgi:hypothetical protein